MDLFNVPAVNDYGIQPFSGYHFNIFVNDAASGNIAWVGAFQSLTYSIRNATETYLEVGQRISMYLDGEINIAWVLEQGMLDGRWMQRTFGTNEISRDQVLQEFPRFHITYDCNAQSLAQAESIDRTYNSQQAARLGATDWKNALNNGQVNPSGLQLPSAANMGRLAQFRYEFSNCKVDNVSGGIMPGRRVPAKRWEGVAQGVRMVEGSVKSLQRTPRGTSLGSVNLTPTITQ